MKAVIKGFVAVMPAVLLLVVCGMVLPVYAQNKAIFAPYSMDSVQVSLPKSVTVEKRSAIDFLLYYFTLSGDKGTGDKGTKRQILFAYLGYHPSFPTEIPKGTKEQRTKINGNPARTFLWKDGDGKLCRETLVNSGVKPIPGAEITDKVHFAYAGLTPDEAKMADAIIATLRPIPRPKQTK